MDASTQPPVPEQQNGERHEGPILCRRDGQRLDAGVTLTPGNEAFRDVLDQMTASTSAGVVVQPDDIAAAVAFLASDDASMIHGTILYVDGGVSATRPFRTDPA